MEDPLSSELGQLVISDLAYLAKSWTSNEIDEYSIRRESAVLRRLLVDGRPTLMRYWKQLGHKGEPRIKAIDLRRALAKPYKSYNVAFAAGAVVNGAEMLICEISSEPLGEPPAVTFPTITQALSQYMAATCLVMAGTPISRRQVVKYVANKLGGVHFDTKRDRNGDDAVFEVMDRERNRYSFLADLDAVHIELLSIGQHLLRTEDVAALIPADRRFDHKIKQLDDIINWQLVETLGPVTLDQPGSS